MNEETVVLKDDSYDELDAMFNTDTEIPGDEVTGEINPTDNKGDDDDATVDPDTDTTDSNVVVDTVDTKATDDADKKDVDKTDADTKSKDDTVIGDTDTDTNAKVDDVDGEKVEDTIVEPDTEAEVRAQLRQQQRQIALTEAKLDTFARQKQADKDAEDTDDDATTVEPSNIEVQQGKLNNLSETRGEIIADMLELMKINPKYEDVTEVCSSNNLADTIELLARSQVAKEGGDLVEVTMAMEVDIWSQRNPYSYMYALIKDIHPQYVDAESKEVSKKGDTDDDGTKKKTPKKAPLSAIDLTRGGGGKNMGEWTAEKIDNLSEDELNTVPADVYQTYLRGDLDK